MKKLLSLFLVLVIAAAASQSAVVLVDGVYRQVPPVQRVTLEWDANSPEDGVVGYRVYFGTSPRGYTDVVDVGSSITHTLTHPLNETLCGVTIYYAVTAYNAEGLESEFSEEVSLTLRKCPPSAPRLIRITSNP